MMKYLAIDTSTEIASVAIKVGEEILCEEHEGQKNHAQWLLPIIDRLMVRAGLQMSQLDGIIFGCGPGSFTGLRITCSIAKGLAYAHDLGLIPVTSLAAIAWSARQLQKDLNIPVLAVLDARMQEMYWAYFASSSFFAGQRVNAVQEIQLPTGQPIVIAGVGIEEYWPDFPEDIQTQTSTKIDLYPNAAAMIQLSQYLSLQSVTVAQAQPVYVRNQVIQGAFGG